MRSRLQDRALRAPSSAGCGPWLCCTSGGVLPSRGFRSTCLFCEMVLPWLSILLQHLGALTSVVDNHPALQAWAIQGLSSFFFPFFFFFFFSFFCNHVDGSCAQRKKVKDKYCPRSPV